MINEINCWQLHCLLKNWIGALSVLLIPINGDGMQGAATLSINGSASEAHLTTLGISINL
jgi:hypothetical protein